MTLLWHGAESNGYWRTRERREQKSRNAGVSGAKHVAVAFLRTRAGCFRGCFCGEFSVNFTEKHLNLITVNSCLERQTGRADWNGELWMKIAPMEKLGRQLAHVMRSKLDSATAATAPCQQRDSRSENVNPLAISTLRPHTVLAHPSTVSGPRGWA